MAENRRIFSAVPVEDDSVLVEGGEAHHLLHVLRAQVGDEITLFDGSGIEFLARVRELDRRTVRVEIIQRVRVDRELPFRMVLGAALPKGERQRILVEKCVELGVTTFVPLVTDRSVAQPTGAARMRLRRVVVEASKQCRRNRLMHVTEPQLLREFCKSNAEADVRWLAHCGSEATPGSQLPILKPPGSVALAVGPEGGFDDEEVALAISLGWDTISLGPRILRVETAAVALAAKWALQI